MGSIKIETIITITDERSKEKKFTITKTISDLTVIEERDYAIAADETRNLWDPITVDTEAMADFDFLLFWSDGTLDLEFTTDLGGTPSFDVKRLYDGIPFMLGADDTTQGTGAIGQTGDVIDKIRADEPNSVARKLKVIMAT